MSGAMPSLPNFLSWHTQKDLMCSLWQFQAIFAEIIFLHMLPSEIIFLHVTYSPCQRENHIEVEDISTGCILYC
jgi:hypothetical protein